MSKLLVIDFSGEEALLKDVGKSLNAERHGGIARFLIIFPKNLKPRLRIWYGADLRVVQCLLVSRIMHADVETILSINEFRDLLAAGRTLRDVWGGTTQVPEVRQEEAVPEPRERDVPVLSGYVRPQGEASWTSVSNTRPYHQQTLTWNDFITRSI